MKVRQGLRQAGTRVDGLALVAGSVFALGCGTLPTYRINFEYPSGHLCLDAYSGQVRQNSYDR
jgi:hypothetical protein